MTKQEWKDTKTPNFSNLTDEELVKYYAMGVIVVRCSGIDVHPSYRCWYIDRRDGALREMKKRSL